MGCRSSKTGETAKQSSQHMDKAQIQLNSVGLQPNVSQVPELSTLQDNLAAAMKEFKLAHDEHETISARERVLIARQALAAARSAQPHASTPLAESDVNRECSQMNNRELRRASGHINFECGDGEKLSESGERYQGHLNARLAALILQKRAVRDAARGSDQPGCSRIRSYSSSSDNSPSMSRTNSRLGTLNRAGSIISDTCLTSPTPPSGLPGRKTRVRFHQVSIHEFSRDWSCAASQPSSGGPALGMGMNCINFTETPLEEYENEREYTRIPIERFHTTGRMSPLERTRILDVRKRS